MLISTAFRIAAAASLALSMTLATTVNAASMYTVTDLGNSYTLQQDSSGTVHGVTSGDGSQAYTFEKAPVSIITSRPYNPLGNPEFSSTTFSSEKMKISSDTVGSMNNVTLYQVYGPYGWGIGVHPIHDINPSGYVVGSGGGPNGAFVSYPGILYYQQYLNYVISDSLGVQLSVALKIDNIGDIIAMGTINGDDHYFLLTTTGSPTPAPEPSTLALLGVGFTGLGIHSARRRRTRLHAGFELNE